MNVRKTLLPIAALALLAGLAPPGGALVAVPPVSDPAVVTIVHFLPGTQPLVLSHPNCSVTGAADYVEVTCGILWPVPRQILPALCLWTSVAATAYDGTVHGESNCWASGASATATGTPLSPGFDSEVTMGVDSMPWTCIGDFTAGGKGVVVCERGVDP